jgi:hypothetical protein
MTQSIIRPGVAPGDAQKRVAPDRWSSRGELRLSCPVGRPSASRCNPAARHSTEANMIAKPTRRKVAEALRLVGRVVLMALFLSIGVVGIAYLSLGPRGALQAFNFMLYYLEMCFVLALLIGLGIVVRKVITHCWQRYRGAVIPD